ncbi:MAG TPA: DUF47 domain-containing protein [Clostridium sp.]|nr:DUF47 domain-containing protein [Clostridium sp.]
MFKFNAKEDKFYNMLSQSADLVNESAKVLRESLNCLEKKNENAKKTSELEDKGDELVRVLTGELNESFITPIDREDIYAIVKEMDKILDRMNSIMHRFIMFDISEPKEEIKTICDLLVDVTDELHEIMVELKTKGCKSKDILAKIMNVSKLESKADKVFRTTIANLFKSEANPIEVMKWKEIYQLVEDTIDNCEKIANIIEGVVIKNA